jgi:hypothetical protein
MNKLYHEIEGELYWARIVGKPYTSNFGNVEWSVDVKLNKKSKKAFLELGLSPDFVKHDDKIGDFVQFKRPGIKKDGEPAQPIAIVDDQVEPWDQNKLIGNGSTAKVRFAVNNRKNPRTGVERLVPSIVAVQIIDHVPYAGKGGFQPVASKAKAEVEDWSEDAA